MSSRGFSLLETLVSLVIVALIATVMMQSLFQVLGLRERVLRHEAEARQAALQQAWFRDSVAALVAEMPERQGGFRGDPEGWSGTSLAGPSGAGLRRIEWRLTGLPGRRVLQLSEDGGPALTIRAVGDRARMRYLGPDGAWQTAWPVTDAASEPLPRAVRLDDPDEGHGLLWWEPVLTGPGLPQPLRTALEPFDADGF